MSKECFSKEVWLFILSLSEHYYETQSTRSCTRDGENSIEAACEMHLINTIMLGLFLAEERKTGMASLVFSKLPL